MEGTTTTELDRMLLESVDLALSALGKSAKDTIVQRIGKEYSIPWEDVPRRMTEFTAILRSLIGAGSRIVEKLVIARLVAMHQISAASAAGRDLPDVVSIIRIYGPPEKQDSVSSNGHN